MQEEHQAVIKQSNTEANKTKTTSIQSLSLR